MKSGVGIGSKGGFSVIAKITHSHVFTKEIIRMQLIFWREFHRKECVRVFSAITRKLA